MSRSSGVRGICPVCNRNVAVMGEGYIARHGSKDKGVWPPQSCEGWGKLPKETGRG